MFHLKRVPKTFSVIVAVVIIVVVVIRILTYTGPIIIANKSHLTFDLTFDINLQCIRPTSRAIRRSNLISQTFSIL